MSQMLQQEQNIDPTIGEVVSEIIKDQDEVWDFKSNNSQALRNPYNRYKNRIAKSSNPYQSEIKDQYRRYHIDQQTGAVLPEFDLEQLEKLRIQQQQFEQHQHQQKGVPISDMELNQIPIQQNQQQLNLDQVRSQLAQNHVNTHKFIPHNQQSPGIYYVNQEDQNVEQDNQQSEQNLSDMPDDAAEQNEQDAYKRPIPTTDLNKVKSKLLSYKKQAKKLDPVYEKERLERRKERISQMGKTTRWLPNTAFTTYYGKPAFENYGMGNVKPTVGGLVYGQYMLSHNVNPHRGNKEPQFIQSHNNAIKFGERQPSSEPQPPRNCKEEFRLSQKQVQEHINRNPLTATKNERKNLKIVKPDLINALRFASEENSPEHSVDSETKVPKNQPKQQSGQIQKSVQIVEPDQNSQASTVQKQKSSNNQIQKSLQKPQQQQRQQQQQTQKLQQSQQSQQSKTKTQKPQQKAQSQVKNIDEKDRGQFMDEVKRKKMNANKIALKVNEVIPVVQRPQSALLDSQVAAQAPVQQNVVQNDFDEMNPPKGYLEQIQDYELNPQNYKNIPPQWLKRIPFAGSKNKTSLPFRLQDM
ncbi:hypothetical protein PPERSA_07473 [Pseudocohnilembus persalinus]|uniref:Uncharacterized protein n=1 Tax=Pseudocohnilembus persalinus TaxID=266149 RepID=A0A0V0R399_PSEPJ|nr:hypothetical protein PPERSA_07473 [Pseudocohnilembus persalinus]|eukprot:KRX08661.1 hypothetical protein PPERSA_07473 [Pseudocohnilembus persalinus]